jgi:hypothetical protein
MKWVMVKSKKISQDNTVFNALSSLDFLLNDILGQIKVISYETAGGAKNSDTAVMQAYNSFVGGEKEFARYTKLIELFFKGIDLTEKINAPKIQDSQPQNNFIEGVEEERI